MAYAPEKDRAYFENGLEELQRYLLSNELYWPCHAPTPDLTQLTVGGLLLVRARLRGWNVSGLEPQDARLDSVRSEWRSAWDAKARREVHARSELWRGFLSGHREDPRGVARLYSQNVRHRAIVALLGVQSDPMDTLLKRIFQPGAFVWDAGLQGGFSQNDFWFLYGTLLVEETS